ncbi:sugar MFS transporter [Polyangium jinanense]|uniref:Sugar MFS transporter n=1 Tax=Polyangium jinanense TaxID=2829994 RepID=A0A9X3X929_9BACT|nr:sugar MFS transporter [Polyangium jinanense]MDC3957605.1 sugar MFS transporter [Polyangium jinanense]MDC3984613.1 sugar MFS transporter [Polyangium jinanense]
MEVSTPRAAAVTDAPSRTYIGALGVVTTIFFMWGFMTCMNDILIPHLKNVFRLGYAEGALVQFSFFSAYFLMSLPAGKLIARIGYKRGLPFGLATAGTGALLFYPAASLPSYPFFLAALFVLATGITILQVTANPYVAVLGPPATASSRLNLTQAFNSLGTTVAPYFGGHFILGAVKQAEDPLAEAHAVRLPYLGLAVMLFVLAGALAVLKLPTIPSVEGEEAKRGTFLDALKYPQLRRAALGIFLYVGAEVAIGSFLVNFFALPSIAAFTEAQAAKYVSLYWGGAMVGRFIGSAVLRKADPGRVLGGSAIVAALLVTATVVLDGPVAMGTILAVGLFNSIMFPTIFTLGIEGLGKLTSQASSILVMSIVGGAIVPVLFGWLADSIGVHHAFLLPALCYLYIVDFGFRGSRRASIAAA